MWQGKRPERIGQPTWLWKSEEMETGTNDPTILQPGNGKSTLYRDKCHFAKLFSFDSIEPPIFWETVPSFRSQLLSYHPLPSLAASMCRKRPRRPRRPRPQLQCLPWTLQLASGVAEERWGRIAQKIRNDLSPKLKISIMVVVSQREREGGRERERYIISICVYTYIYTHIHTYINILIDR